MNQTEILLTVLEKSINAIAPAASTLLKQAFPSAVILETEDQFFKPWTHSDEWSITVHPGEGQLSQFDTHWWAKKEEPYRRINGGWLTAKWQGKEIQLMGVATYRGHCSTIRWFVIAEDQATADGFFSVVCRFNSTIKGSVLVFQEANWYPDKELFESIQKSHLDELVLHGALKEQIQTDIGLFFEQEETYRRFKIPWKRGMLFLAPPGNGKTHLLRALVNHFDKPCLYVKSFRAQYNSAQTCVANAFERAREVAPCFFILEDLDTLLTGETRSYFLNEMDGFASNDGIVTIASCNFPDRLDAAILDRPSRFDRKYHFELPEAVDRRRYLEIFMGRFTDELKLDAKGLDAISEVTAGYSYAYLKELYVSAAVRWISTESNRPIEDVLAEQSEALRSQMVTELTTVPVPPEPGEFLEIDDDEPN